MSLLTAKEHAERIQMGLDTFRGINSPNAVEDPANDFEKAVEEWASLSALQDEIKTLMRSLNEQERLQRESIAASLRTYFGGDLKEGVNNYNLSNARKLKFTHKVDRKIDAGHIESARAEFALAPAATRNGVAFDDLLRVKYELAATPFKKIPADSAAGKAVARMITTKFAAPVMEVD